MKTYTVNLFDLKTTDSTDGADVSPGLQMARIGDKVQALLGQYGREDAKLTTALLCKKKPAKIDSQSVVLDAHPVYAGERIFLEEPAHPHNRILVRVSTKTERDLRLSLGGVDEGAEIIGGGHGSGGPSKSRWDDVLVSLAPFQGAEIKNGKTVFVVINNGGEAALVTKDEYDSVIRPHISA